jgi:hypothetical protein
MEAFQERRSQTERRETSMHPSPATQRILHEAYLRDLTNQAAHTRHPAPEQRDRSEPATRGILRAIRGSMRLVSSRRATRGFTQMTPR